MYSMMQPQRQHHHQPQHHAAAPAPAAGSSSDDARRTHLTKFAFLLSSARGEGSDEPVVGMHHDVEMAACFSERHLRCSTSTTSSSSDTGGGCWGGGNNVMPVNPPSISSSSLSMQSKGGIAGGNDGNNNNDGPPSKKRRSSLMETAAMNMSTPFYTTPDTVSSTAKTILKNLVTTMEELMDSRLRSTVSQLVNKSGGIANSQLLFRLLSPSRNPVQVATVITRFVIPDDDDAATADHNQNDNGGTAADGGLLSIPLKFKAILDVKIFGVVSTVELCAPVTMSGMFDVPGDGLLSAVDVSFDCAALLRAMISRGRAVVKTAVIKAAALSVQIAEWHAKSGGKQQRNSSIAKADHHHRSSGSGLMRSAHSLHSLLGSTVSLNSLAGSSHDAKSTLSSLFASYSSLSKQGTVGGSSLAKSSAGDSSGRRGSLRNHHRPARNGSTVSSLLRSRNRQSDGSSNTNNANETFDLGGTGGHGGGGGGGGTVRFKIPNTYKSNGSNNATAIPRSSSGSTASSVLPQQELALKFHQLQQQQQPQPPPPPPQPSITEEQQQDKGNIHQGLFSWLQDDKMFLTEEKIQEQNAADAERDRRMREAPMPLRFFTAAEDLGGGASGLEMVSNSIFGRGSSSSAMVANGAGEKRRREF